MQQWTLQAIEATPKPVRFGPALGRQFRSAIDGMPVRRVMLREPGGLPGNAECSEHLQVSIRVCPKRIEQCAVPVKQHRPKRLVGQHKTIVADALAQWPSGPERVAMTLCNEV